MGFNFPASPTLGQTYPASPTLGMPQYQWDGSAWILKGSPTSPTIYVSPTPPGSPVDNALWFNSQTGLLFLRFNDGNTTQWVITPPAAASAVNAASINAVQYSAQALTPTQQTQTAQNISAVQYAAQTLTADQQAQARANIGALKKNYVLNGAMMISQENGTAALSGSGGYPVDMFQYAGGTTSGAVSYGQVQVGTPGGSTHRIRVTVTTPDATQDVNDFTAWQTVVEGYRYADLWAGLGASPKQMTLRFGVKAPAGTYCVAFRNYSTTRSYVAEYTIAAGEANTDVVKSVTLPATDGTTFEFTNAPGIYITWAFICGSTFRTTPNGWRTGNFMGTANQTNFMATNGNVFELFDVSLTEGTTVAPPFQVPDYASELVLCQRYWQKINAIVDTSAGFQALALVPPMRAIPTVTGGGAGFTAFNYSYVALNHYQTTRAQQTLTISARL